jgi:hypothetical protein
MPGDTKPHKARRAKKRRRIRKVGDLDAARKKLWQAITTAEDVLLGNADDDTMTLKAVHAMTQACTAYAKLVEASELEARLVELEQMMQNRNNKQQTRAYA